MRCIEDVTESADVGRSKAAVVGLRLEEEVSRLALRLGQLQDAMGIRII